MKFPPEILPNPFYRKINCELTNHYLIRSTIAKDPNEIINPETGLVKQEHICTPRDHVADLSTSLLGVFETSFIKIDLTENGKDKYNEYCEPNILVDPPIFNHDFIINSRKLFWVILIGTIHNTEVEYQKGDLPFKARCIVEHTPMKWNYWHFSIRWSTDNIFWHSLDEKSKKKLAKRLGQEARSHITMFASVEEPNYSELSLSDYT